MQERELKPKGQRRNDAMIRIPKPGLIRQRFSARRKMRKTVFNQEEIEAVLAQYDLGDWTVGGDLGGGSSDNVLLQTGRGKKVLKRYYWPWPAALTEHSILHHLAGTGFPLPQIEINKLGLSHTALGTQSYAIYDFVSGYCANHYFMPLITRKQLVTQAGKMLAFFHQLMDGIVPEGQKFNGFKPNEARLWRDVAWCLAELEQYVEQTSRKPLLDELDTFLMSIVDEVRHDLVQLGHFVEQSNPQLPRLVTHGDYSPKNVLFNQKKLVAVLDFGDACIHLRAFDVARGVTSFAITREKGVNKSLARTFLRAYQTCQPLSKSEIEAIPDLIRWRYLQNIIWPLGRLHQSRKSSCHLLQLSRNKWQSTRWMKRNGDELRTVLLSAS